MFSSFRISGCRIARNRCVAGRHLCDRPSRNYSAQLPTKHNRDDKLTNSLRVPLISIRRWHTFLRSVVLTLAFGHPLTLFQSTLL